MNEQYSALRSNVSMLGKVLGETIKDALGEHILDRVETIRKLSKSSRAGNEANRQELLTTLQNLSNDELLPVARAFSQFLNLANTAEQYHSISPKGEAASNPEVIARTLRKLKNQPDLNDATIKKAVESLSLELVLTAHPTEITRRTLIHKMGEINNCLKQLDNTDIADYERHQVMRRLRQLIAQSWHTDEIRKQRPSPVDEAKWGFAVVENSLWQGVPNYLRELNEQLEENLGYKLPVDFVPVRFTSWMGGDRDGNPNVTADITRHVLLLSRWKATDLFLKDIHVLVSELSMVDATPELLALVGEEGASEPYRYLMKKLRARLMATQSWLEARLKGEKLPKPAGLLTQNEQLWEPLYACYQSLQACGMGIIANGELLDTLRRVKCFGVPLVRIDIRQESTRHTEALGEITRYLGIGDYESWSEADKQAFLIRELNSKRPLLPRNWEPSNDTREVLETCKVIAEAPKGSIFAWTQNRLMLPAWLGAGTALQKVVEDGKQSELEAMCRDWPFFSTRLGMLEMVFSKADLWLADYYDQRLVAKTLWPLGKELRDLLEEDIKVVLAIANDSHLMADLPWIAESIQLRNVYTDPLNVLQAELLYRSRLTEEQGKSPDPRVEQALMVTIAGVAAGMRNTG
ncbi:phosphoenolpyruvate carboxylase [Salmonella enterica subsp. enterica serovar Dublin]|uniref:phosphoenolpyruvate carboxylase n=1 Tax=Salmonella enterica TaxID=28901 RepID=UPI000D3DFA1A|nr:phosphoenolpyruvate carboxylase [Salmonella enterica]PUL70939.1 phosphoenolpyruvate carboxylase [Salmonella enterica subsp. enterica serovar Dublin]